MNSADRSETMSDADVSIPNGITTSESTETSVGDHKHVYKMFARQKSTVDIVSKAQQSFAKHQKHYAMDNVEKKDNLTALYLKLLGHTDSNISLEWLSHSSSSASSIVYSATAPELQMYTLDNFIEDKKPQFLQIINLDSKLRAFPLNHPHYKEYTQKLYVNLLQAWALAKYPTKIFQKYRVGIVNIRKQLFCTSNGMMFANRPDTTCHNLEEISCLIHDYLDNAGLTARRPSQISPHYAIAIFLPEHTSKFSDFRRVRYLTSYGGRDYFYELDTGNVVNILSKLSYFYYLPPEFDHIPPCFYAFYFDKKLTVQGIRAMSKEISVSEQAVVIKSESAHESLLKHTNRVDPRNITILRIRPYTNIGNVLKENDGKIHIETIEHYEKYKEKEAVLKRSKSFSNFEEFKNMEINLSFLHESTEENAE